MTREQAINYLYCSGFSEEQVSEVVRALTYEPTPKNDLGVDCIDRADARSLICKIDRKYMFNMSGKAFQDLYKGIDDLPSVTPQLSVPEVTALAEWTEKLTKASEDAYNKGYEAGMKAQEPILDKIDEIITDALDKSTDQKESQTLRWVLDKISEVT